MLSEIFSQFFFSLGVVFKQCFQHGLWKYGNFAFLYIIRSDSLTKNYIISSPVEILEQNKCVITKIIVWIIMKF